MDPGPSRTERLLAWGVHVYTGLGIPLAFLGATALAARDAELFFLTNWLTTAIDATDGTLARRLRVKEVVPEFDGSKLDDIVDYLTFAFLPSLGFVAFGLLPAGFAWVAALPAFASGYQFCQAKAKTDDSFVGFPSYWNIVVLYLYVLGADPWVNVAVISVLAALVFVPIHYLYPSKARFLRGVTLVFGSAWALALIPVCLAPNASWASTVAWASLAFPVYYLVASLVHHARVHERALAP